MDETNTTIGLPPEVETSRPAPTAADLWRARALNLVGVVVPPAANMGFVLWGPRDVRWFGVGAGVLCTAAFVLARTTGRPVMEAVAVGVHLTLAAIGLVHPLAIGVVARAWTAFGRGLGEVMAWPIFGAIYYLAVTPTALYVRLTGKDPMSRRGPPRESYWVPHKPPALERYERQF